MHHRFVHDAACRLWRGRLGILIHQLRQQFAVERAPVDADADGLAVAHRRFDDGAELAIFLVLETDVAGIDPILVERFGAGRIVAQELVADVMEIADQRHVDAALAQLVTDVGHGFCGLIAIDRNADEFRSGAGEIGNLIDRRCDVGRVGVGHRLDDDWRAAADRDAADHHGDGFMTGFHCDAVAKRHRSRSLRSRMATF